MIGLPEKYKLLNIGMSGAEVRDYGDKILKIQPHSAQSVNEAVFMRFLGGKILVPDVLSFQTRDGYDYLLMTKLSGEMLCSETYLEKPEKLFETAADVLYRLWAIPVRDCPSDMGLQNKLRVAEKNVAEGAVDPTAVNPATFGKNGRFANPEKLLFWLKDNKPEEDVVITHGDFCLPNILCCGGQTGLIDFLYGGRADRYCDIALLYRSCRDNLEGGYGKRYCAFDEKLFFDVLSITPDREKIDYYILLDELF